MTKLIVRRQDYSKGEPSLKGAHFPEEDSIVLYLDDRGTPRFTPDIVAHEIGHWRLKHESPSRGDPFAMEIFIEHELAAWNWAYSKSGKPRSLIETLKTLLVLGMDGYNRPYTEVIDTIGEVLDTLGASQWSKDYARLKRKGPIPWPRKPGTSYRD